MDDVISILETFRAKCGVPYAYDHFDEGEAPDPPFICYRIPESDNFSADGTVYLDIDVIDIELYTDEKDPKLEKKLQKLLKQYGISYEKSEVWIESERLYEVIYEFETAGGDSAAGEENEEEE